MTEARVSPATRGTRISCEFRKSSYPQLNLSTHVLLLSVDGLHQKDLDLYVKNHPTSALAALVNHGTSYTHAQTPVPSDSFPDMVGQLTGGNPGTTGVYYDDTFNRALLPVDPATCKPVYPHQYLKVNTVFEAAKSAQQCDGYKVQAVLNEIDGKDHSGTKTAAVPGIFGMNFQAVSTAQKLPTSDGFTGGYLQDGTVPGPSAPKPAMHATRTS